MIWCCMAFSIRRNSPGRTTSRCGKGAGLLLTVLWPSILCSVAASADEDPIYSENEIRELLRKLRPREPLVPEREFADFYAGVSRWLRLKDFGPWKLREVDRVEYSSCEIRREALTHLCRPVIYKAMYALGPVDEHKDLLAQTRTAEESAKLDELDKGIRRVFVEVFHHQGGGRWLQHDLFSFLYLAQASGSRRDPRCRMVPVRDSWLVEETVSGYIYMRWVGPRETTVEVSCSPENSNMPEFLELLSAYVGEYPSRLTQEFGEVEGNTFFRNEIDRCVDNLAQGRGGYESSVMMFAITWKPLWNMFEEISEEEKTRRLDEWVKWWSANRSLSADEWHRQSFEDLMVRARKGDTGSFNLLSELARFRFLHTSLDRSRLHTDRAKAGYQADVERERRLFDWGNFWEVNRDLQAAQGYQPVVERERELFHWQKFWEANKDVPPAQWCRWVVDYHLALLEQYAKDDWSTVRQERNRAADREAIRATGIYPAGHPYDARERVMDYCLQNLGLRSDEFRPKRDPEIQYIIDVLLRGVLPDEGFSADEFEKAEKTFVEWWRANRNKFEKPYVKSKFSLFDPH